MLLMIDNYDSFTYNLVQYFGELGADVHVQRNDAITLEQIAAWQPERIVISPGPCTPDQAGISVALIERFAGGGYRCPLHVQPIRKGVEFIQAVASRRRARLRIDQPPAKRFKFIEGPLAFGRDILLVRQA